MFGSHYYGTNGTTRSYIPARLLSRHKVDEFVGRCERTLGRTIAEQAESLLARRGCCEEQNRNALFRLLGFAMDCQEFELALALGDYFDRHP